MDVRRTKMSLRKALLAATVLSLPVAAQAQPVTGLYVAAGAGGNYRMDQTGNLGPGLGAISAGLPQTYRLGNELGYAAVVSVGWGFGNGIRAEIEGNYRFNELRGGQILGTSNTFGRGYIAQYGVMGNAFYDINLQGFGISPRVWMPYVGVGAGYVWSDYDRGRIDGANFAVPPAVGIRQGAALLDGRAGRFAYQAIVGGALGLHDFVPGLSLTGEYRFMGTLAPDVARVSAVVNPAVPGSGVLSVPSSTANYNHSFMLGLRYQFNYPRPAAAVVAPAPAPAPAAAPARTYLVFFDWDRADLTDRARQVIAEAAQNAQRVGSTRIEVSGHADRTGTAQYNQRLSVRRAEAVAAELVRRGVARNQIGIQGFGFERPLVPTAQGVREPQNRRVEIVLR
jgi:outer membrane protein OmpA-like peptidoglycan-associated protein